MTELSWYELFPPREVTLADVTATMRILAGRPRRGVQRLTPVVAFELWLRPGRVRWLLAVDASLASHLPGELRAQLPGLGLLRVDPQRPVPTTARELRCDRLSFPLRLDTAAAVAAGVVQLAGQLGRHETAVVQWVIGPSHTRTRQPAQFNAFEALGLRTPSPPDSSQRQAWKAKTAEPLFGVRGRIGATAASASRAGAIMRPLLAALSLANGPHAQLRASRQSSRTAQQLHSVLGRARTWSGIVNAAELAVLLAWPLDGLEVPGHGVHLGPTPTPLLRDDNASTSASDDERLLGRSLHPASAGQLVHLPTVSCLSHVHVIGPTGSGKSTALAQWITADAAAGRSVLVLEPKGDLVADVLARLPAERHDDVVVIEPGETDAVVGFNPLTGPRDQAERRADELLGLFRELFGTAIGPRSADLLLHALITAARLPDGTLTDVPALLTNPGFRRHALAQVSDPLVLAPFWAWFDSISDAERTQVVAPVMNKLRVLVSRPAIRRMLGQAAPRFALDELFTKRRIVLINLNQGGIGPETARLLGALLLQQLWRAIQRRTQVPVAKRHPVMVVIDEFQDFVGALDFGDVLAQARGLGVSVTAAHQHLAQLDPSLRAAVLANARSRLAFRPAQGDAKALAAVLGTGVTPDDLERLGAFQAAARVLVKSAPSAAFAVQTLPLGEPTSDAGGLRAQSATRYGLPAAELDARLTIRWQGMDRPPDAPVGLMRRRRP